MVTFKDRIPTYAGRVILTPVEGQPNTYDLTRADQPTEVGTPVNAALFAALENEMVQLAYGSYTGDGGATKTFNFDFEPQFLMVVKTGNSQNLLFTSKGHNASGMSGDLASDSAASYFTSTWGDNTVILSDAPGGTTALKAGHILNSSSTTYAYFAIGMPN